MLPYNIEFENGVRIMACRCIIIAILIIIQIPSLFTLEVTAGEEIPEVINFIEDNSTASASVEPGNLRPYIIRGYIDGTVFDHYNVTKAIFQLHASISSNWTMIVEPRIIVLQIN